jgi:hypothetical protein
VHDARLAEQEAGGAAFHVLVAEDGRVIGRFNLLFAGPGMAELGYRVAEDVSGRGVALPAAHAPGRHLDRQRRIAAGALEGRVRPGRSGRSGPYRRQAGHLVRARPHG